MRCPLCLVLVLSLLLASCEQKARANVAQDVHSPETTNSGPFVGQKLWVDSTSAAWAYMQSIARTDPARAAQIGEIARQPLVPWFTDPGVNMREHVNDLVTRIHGAGAVPIFVLYAIPQRDCGSFASGGARTAAAYREWIAGAAEGIGERRAIVILEPDALNEIDCLSASALTE